MKEVGKFYLQILCLACDLWSFAGLVCWPADKGLFPKRINEVIDNDEMRKMRLRMAAARAAAEVVPALQGAVRL